MTGSIARRSLLLGTAGLLALPHVARAAARPVRMGHNNTDSSHYGQGTSAFAKSVAADPVLAGAITVSVHGGGALGDELGMLRGITKGMLDLMICSSSVVSNVVPEVGLLNAPFAFRDVSQVRAALDGAFGEDLAALAKDRNAMVLAWGENGLRHITSNRPVRTPADLHGLKIRVPQSEVIIGGLRALGAEAGPLPFNLLREALRTGQFQAQENPIVVIEAAKLQELHSNLSLTGHIYDGAAVLASSDLLEDLTAPQRAALADCGRRAAAVTRDAAEDAQRSGVARLRAAGMTVHDGIDRAMFAAAARPYLESLSGRYGEERTKRLLNAGA